ncbi:MAG: NUDIX hydrolase [Methanosarcina sp.]
MKKKILLDSKEEENISNNGISTVYGWKSDLKEGIVFKNENLGVTIYRFAVLEEDDTFQYDTFGIEQRNSNCVSIVVNQEDKICLLKEYRFMPKKYFLSCPRGFANFDGESRYNCSLREMKEEIGNYELIDSIDLGDLYQDTAFYISSMGVKLVKIRMDNLNVLNDLQKSEDIEGISFYSVGEVKNMIKKEEIVCGITLGALAKYFAYLDS